MLNKLKFNNLVISNKKGIQQALTQTINKLVHKIRKLKALLEKHPDNTKCKERVRKSTETMELLKKLKRVDIMKNVLLMDKPPAAIITNGLATPNEVGVALLAMNKVMQGLIKRFKTELLLDDKDSDKWKEDLRETSKRRQKIERTEEKRRKRLEIKSQKAMGRKRQEWLEQNNQAGEGDEGKLDPDANVSTVGKWKIEELKTEEKITLISKKNEKRKVADLKRPLKDNPIKKVILNEKVKKEDVLLSKANKIENSYSEDESEMKVIQKNASDKRSEDEEKLQDFSYINERNDKPEDSKEDEEETLVVDPFFITDTGENYLSTAVIKRGQLFKNENNEDNKDLHMIKLNNNNNKKQNDFKERRQQYRDTKQQNYRDRNNQTREKYQQNKWNKGNSDQKSLGNKWNSQNDKFRQNKSDNKDGYNNKKNQRDQDLTTENLHPSWAAKQKIKPVITNFQGTKITFGDNDNNSNTYTQPQNNSSKKQALKSLNMERDSLHPSWAAKQRLKPTINVFQGKKITFDNDD